MKLSSKKFLFALGALALGCQPLFAEPRHDSGAGDTFNLSRPSTGKSSAKKLSDVVNSCFAGRGGSGSGSTLGINPGLGEIGGGIGSGGGGLGVPGTGANTPPQGAVDTASLAPKACTKCHGIKPAQASIDAINGKIEVPNKMKDFLAGLSPGEKSEMVAFFENRKAQGR